MVIHSSGSQISKQEIRAYVLQKRRTLLPEEQQRWDEALLERLHPLFPSAGTAVYAYTSVRGEASTEYLIDELLKRGCRVALPRVFGREMRFFYVTDRSQLVAGAYGIPEPADGCQEADAPKALVITPGVGFSKDGNRIGYGAGYYDRFLAHYKGAKLLLCPEAVLTDTLPCDDWDAHFAPEEILTEKGIQV